ncbi:MAG: carbon starvation CstA family protein [Faecalibacterium sp.]
MQFPVSTACVSSGTSSKTVENEKDMLKVGYGAMILKACWLFWLCAWPVPPQLPTVPLLPVLRSRSSSRGVAGFFEMFGVPAYAATVFMTMCVSALALTSLDAVARIGRMSFQELFSVDDMEHAEGWRKLFCNVYFSTFITLVFGFILTKIGYANIWPLFGSANQLLSALVAGHPVRVPEGDRPQQQDAVPPADHHAVRHLYRTGAAPDRYGQGHQHCRFCYHPCR